MSVCSLHILPFKLIIFWVRLSAIASCPLLHCIFYSNKHTHAQAHTCLRKCQVWLTLQPTVMFKVIHLRLGGIRELIGAGTVCPIGFPGQSTHHTKPVTEAQPWFIVLCKGKTRSYIHLITNLLDHSFLTHTPVDTFLHQINISQNE